MTTDLKIELFGKDLFTAMWKRHGHITELSQQREKRKSEFTENIFRAVHARLSMCHYSYESFCKEIYGEFIGNYSDFYQAVVTHFPHYVAPTPNPCPEMVMGSFLYSCAFVSHLCMFSHSNGDDFFPVGHKVWCMFVDFHLKDLFYSSGGWKKLHEFADHDVVTYNFVRTFSTTMDISMGNRFMLHVMSMTGAAVESFDQFESWEGVDDEAPLVLKWVDYCVLVPPKKISLNKYHDNMEPDVFQKLEAVITDLGYILNPDRPGDYLNHFDPPMRIAGSPETKADAPDSNQLKKSPLKSKYLKGCVRDEDAFNFPISPISHAGIPEEVGEDFDGEVMAAIDPLRSRDCFAREEDASSLPMTQISHFESEGIGPDFIVFEGDVSTETDPRNLLEIRNPVQKTISVDADIADSPLKVDKSNDDRKNNSPVDSNGHISKQSNTFNKNENQIPQTNHTKDLEESSVETQSELYSFGIIITPNDSIDFPEIHDTSGTRLKTNINPNDFDSFMDQFGLDRCATYAPPDSKRRVALYMKTASLEDNAVSNGSVEYSPKRSLSTQADTHLMSSIAFPDVNVLSYGRESPPTSTNVSASIQKRESYPTSPEVIVLSHRRESHPTFPEVTAMNSRRKPPPTSANVPVLSQKHKSPNSPISVLKNALESPNVNDLMSTLKSLLTSPNVNVLSNTRKSPLASPNVNDLSNTRRSPLTSPNVNDLRNARKSPLASPNLNKRGSPSGLFIKSSTGKENSPSTKSKAEIKRSPSQKHARFTLDSSTETYSQKFEELNRDDSPIKASFCPRHLYFDTEKILLPDGKKINPTTDVEKKIISNSLKCALKSTDQTANWPHQNSTLDKNDEHDEQILEKSLQKLDLKENHRMRPSKDVRPRNQTISRESCSTGKRQLKKDQNSSKPLKNLESTKKDNQSRRHSMKKVQSSSAESTTENQIKGTSGVDDKSMITDLKEVKLLQEEHEMPSKVSTNKSPFNDFDEKEKKWRKESNSTDLNPEALQESENATAVPVLENASGISSETQDAEKKGKKKKPKKKLSRLEERIREEGDAIKDVMRLIFVMGHRPGMLSVASAVQDFKKLLPEDENNEK